MGILAIPMRKLHKQRDKPMRTMFFVTLLLPAMLHAQVISQHNEEQAAIKAAYAILFDEGCKRPTHSRAERIILSRTETGLQIRGNAISFVCEDPSPKVLASWDMPTEREGGIELPPDQIGGYILAVNGKEYEVTETSKTITLVSPGFYVFKVLCFDTDGIRSVWSPPITREL